MRALAPTIAPAMMTRRTFLAALLATTAMASLSACEEQASGPAEIVWDRDACDLCRMLISEAAYAAQLRAPDGTLYKFDDLGEAVVFLERQPWHDDPGIEFWVADATSTRDSVQWIDARRAHYTTGHHSPMDFGFAAHAPHGTDGVLEPGALDFAAMRTAALARGDRSQCLPPTRVVANTEVGS